MKIALLIGGPSPERGISLNSARSVLDHLESDKIEIIPIYFDYKKTPYLISRSQLYSNTPSDFDFKLHKNAKSLTAKTLLNLLKKVDLAFPVMHGVFGEDGQIQRYLEKNNIPYIVQAHGSVLPFYQKTILKKIENLNSFWNIYKLRVKKKR